MTSGSLTIVTTDLSLNNFTVNNDGENVKKKTYPYKAHYLLTVRARFVLQAYHCKNSES